VAFRTRHDSGDIGGRRRKTVRKGFKNPERHRKKEKKCIGKRIASEEKNEGKQDLEKVTMQATRQGSREEGMGHDRDGRSRALENVKGEIGPLRRQRSTLKIS